MPPTSNLSDNPKTDNIIGTANIVGSLLSTITYGVHLTLFLYLLRLYFDENLWIRRSRLTTRRPRMRLLAYAVPLFLLATTGLCLQTWLNHRAFIEHRDFHGPNGDGPFAFMMADSDDPGNRALAGVYIVLNWVSDGMLLWRFYLLFSQSRIILTICVTMLASMVVVGSVFLPQLSTLNINLWTKSGVASSLGYIALSLSLNVILTIAIAVRLLLIRRRFERSIGAGTRLYNSIALMFINSAAVHAVVAFICIIALAVGSPVQIALLPMLGQLQAIPSILITLRIMEINVVASEPQPTTHMASIQFYRRTISPALNSAFASEGYSPSYPDPCVPRGSWCEKSVGSTANSSDSYKMFSTSESTACSTPGGKALELFPSAMEEDLTCPSSPFISEAVLYSYP